MYFINCAFHILFLTHQPCYSMFVNRSLIRHLPAPGLLLLKTTKFFCSKNNLMININVFCIVLGQGRRKKNFRGEGVTEKQTEK